MAAVIVIIGGLPLPGSAPVASAADNASEGAGVVRIEVLSNRADVISGDDALVEIVLPKGAAPGDLEVTVGGRNVTDAFAPRPKLDNRLVGLLRELEVGRNPVTARLRDGRGAHITITNHPIGGPVFAGPQTQPWRFPCMVARTEEDDAGGVGGSAIVTVRLVRAPLVAPLSPADPQWRSPQ